MEEKKVIVKEGVQHIQHNFKIKINVQRLIREHPELDGEPIVQKGIEGPVDVADQYMIRIKGCGDQRFRISSADVRGFVKPSIWDRIKGDFYQFLIDLQVEKFKKEDVPAIKRDFDEFKKDVKRVRRIFR